MPSDFRTPAEDRDGSAFRTWTRFAADRSVPAVLFDESYGGVGLSMELAAGLPLAPGDPLVVVYYGSPMSGQVQWVQRRPDDRRVRLGVRWSP